MSLVAYGSSSDEESENEDDIQESVNKATANSGQQKQAQRSSANGEISDEDDDYVPEEQTLDALSKTGIGSLNLPKPKNAAKDLNEEPNETIAPALAKLPIPKAGNIEQLIEEEDDEFLHKKATVPIDVENKKPPQIRVPVKISVPSMKDFSDVDEEIAKSGKNKTIKSKSAVSKRSGLLSVLPQAKSEQNFSKVDKQLPSTSTNSSKPLSKPNSLIPDTVRNCRPAHNTESVDGVRLNWTLKKGTAQKTKLPKTSLVACSDSEASDDEHADFFSLNKDEKLPEVNANEINVMVAKRAAKMSETTTKYLEANADNSTVNQEEIEHDAEELRQAQKRYHESQLNEEALQALVGSSSKRRRQQHDIEIVDISSNQVLPDREEWMRSALASQTSYQPTGVLVDEEPASGTRRKHQITYLAHKAKANEAELQAMWSANRQNRRATQSKYGF